jgi:hypothetical protein
VKFEKCQPLARLRLRQAGSFSRIVPNIRGTVDQLRPPRFFDRPRQSSRTIAGTIEKASALARTRDIAAQRAGFKSGKPCEPPLGHHLLQISVAERVTEIPELCRR